MIRPLTPALLIGGKSSRMGSHKSLLEKENGTLAFYLASLLKKITGKTPVLLGEGNLGPGSESFLQLPDPELNRGPLAGLVAFANCFPNEDLLILPTDLYAMSETALSWMVHESMTFSDKVLWPKQPQRRHGEPLAAIYPYAVFPQLQKAWELGKGSPCQAISEEFRAEPVIPDSLRLAFVNINTPEELKAVKKGLEGQMDQHDRELLFPTSHKRAHK